MDIVKAQSNMELSIIIPTYNRREVLNESLKLIFDSKTDFDYEVIIVDDGSENGILRKLTDDIRKYSRVKLFTQNHAGPGAARNLGIAKASGKIILFINDDTLVGKDFLKKHVTYHKKNQDWRAALVGPFIENPDIVTTPIMRWLVNESNLHFNYDSFDSVQIPWYYFWTCNASIKRKFFISKKIFFNETFPVAAWEDVEFGYRANEAGLKIFFDKKLNAYHNHFFYLKDVLSRFYTHGRGMYHLVGRIPNEFLPILARKNYQLIARFILNITGYKYTKEKIIKWFDLEKKPVNFLMQYLIIGHKISGWDFERNLK